MAGWASKNRDYFDKSASSYNRKFSGAILQIIEEIQTRKSWIGVDWVSESEPSDKVVRLLDYACGTGLVSRALASSITQARGIDVSTSMVQEYNSGFATQGVPESKAKAVVGNLIDDEGSSSDSGKDIFSGPEWHNFDIAAVGMGWHHFQNPSYAAKALSARLKPGGTLFLVDFLPHEMPPTANNNEKESAHNHQKGDRHVQGRGDDTATPDAAPALIHTGFTMESIQKMFEEAGVAKDFDFVTAGDILLSGEGSDIQRPIFMAKGVKK